MTMEVTAIRTSNPQTDTFPNTTERHTTECAKCRQGVKAGVEYRDSIWHRNCFTCSNCPKVLAGSKFVSQDEKPYCFLCYADLFANKCASCKLPIFGLGDGFLISMEGFHWHIACFLCSRCERPLLGELSVNKSHGIFCLDCFSYVSSNNCDL